MSARHTRGVLPPEDLARVMPVEDRTDREGYARRLVAMKLAVKWGTNRNISLRATIGVAEQIDEYLTTGQTPEDK